MSIALGLGGFPANFTFPLTVPAKVNEEQSSKANQSANIEDLRMKGVSPRELIQFQFSGRKYQGLQPYSNAANG
jgi:hypothetical protein